MVLAGAVSPAAAAVPELDDTISLTQYPRSIVASATGDVVYVTVDNSFAVKVIDTDTNAVVRSIDLGTMRPGLMLGSPDVSRLFVVGGTRVAVIDTATDAVTMVQLTGDVQSMKVSPDGSKVYVTTTNASNTITVINAATATIQDTTTTTAVATALAVSPDGDWLYYSQSDGLYRIQTGMMQKLWLSTPQNVSKSALSPAGSILYVVDGTNTISAVDTDSGAVLDTIPSSSQAVSIALSTDGSELYRINTEMSMGGPGGPGGPGGFTQTSTLAIIDTATGDLISTAPLPWSSWQIFVHPDDGLVWVTGAEGVAVVDPTTATTESVDLVFAIVSVAFLPNTDRAYAITDGGGAAYALTLAGTAPPLTPPSAPGSAMAIAGADQAFVSWSAPNSDGGAAVSSYTVTSSPGGASCTTSTLSCVVTGLTTGVSYTFAVIATNSVGASVPATTAPVTVVASVAPSTPPASTSGTSVRLVAADGSAVSSLVGGQQFFVEVTGFAPVSTVEATLYSTPVRVGTGVTDGSGAARFSVTIPSSLASGAHTLVVSGFGSAGQTAFAAVGVTAPGAAAVTPGRTRLANSGSAADASLAVAVSLLVLGGALLVATRRARGLTH